MKKRIMLTLILIIGLIATTLALAQPRMDRPERGPADGPHLKMLLGPLGEEIGLTDAQRQELQDTGFATQKELIHLHAQVKIAELELRQMMDSDTPDENAVYRKIDEIGALKTDIRKKQMGLRLTVQSVLTDEQVDQLKDLRHERMQDRFHDRRFERKDRPRGDNKAPRSIE